MLRSPLIRWLLIALLIVVVIVVTYAYGNSQRQKQLEQKQQATHEQEAAKATPTPTAKPTATPQVTPKPTTQPTITPKPTVATQPAKPSSGPTTGSNAVPQTGGEVFYGLASAALGLLYYVHRELKVELRHSLLHGRSKRT